MNLKCIISIVGLVLTGLFLYDLAIPLEPNYLTNVPNYLTNIPNYLTNIPNYLIKNIPNYLTNIPNYLTNLPNYFNKPVAIYSGTHYLLAPTGSINIDYSNSESGLQEDSSSSAEEVLLLQPDFGLAASGKSNPDLQPGFGLAASGTTILFTVNFNRTIMQPNYVKYIGTKGGANCDSTYIKVDTMSDLKHADLTNTGYNRGHLVPKEDYGCETMVITNAVPMKPAFNQGSWKKSENKIRKYFYDHDIYKGCEYSFDSFIQTPTNKTLYIPLGCYYVVFDQEQTLIDYGYFANAENSRQEYRLPYWIGQSSNF